MISNLPNSLKVASAMAILSFMPFSKIQAQTISTLEDVTFDETFDSYGLSILETGETIPFSFNSGHLSFYGQKEFWGGLTGFDCSKSTDNTTYDFSNDRSAISGAGSTGSSKYGIAYLNSDWPDNPTSTIPIGIKLTDAAAGSYALSMDVTNTTYTYFWLLENALSVSYLNLTIKGYLDGEEVGDSIFHSLASTSPEGLDVLDYWESIDLTPLGAIDSITFKLDSDNDWIPFYFAFDNIVTFNNDCNSSYVSATAEGLSTTSLIINHTSEYPQAVKVIEYAIDNSSTLNPIGTTNSITDFELNIDGLEPNTDYVYHYRTKCINDMWSEWDTLNFSTFNTNIENTSVNNFNIYPNPATDFINISGELVNNRIMMVNIIGQKIHEGPLSSKISIKNLPNGVYFIQITNEDNNVIFTSKFLKQ